MWNQKSAELKRDIDAGVFEEKGKIKANKIPLTKQPMTFQRAEDVRSCSLVVLRSFVRQSATATSTLQSADAPAAAPAPLAPAAPAPASSAAQSSTPAAKAAPSDGRHICTLCRRLFTSAEMLAKHEQLSDRHRENLEIARAKQELFHKEFEKAQAERRAQEQLERVQRQQQTHLAPASAPIADDNVGSRMLKKLGYVSRVVST